LTSSYYYNERSLFNAIKHGSCPPIKNEEALISRNAVKTDLKTMFKPPSNYRFYHAIVGEHGTGKTTVVKQAAREVGKGVIYVDVPENVENFAENLGNAFRWKDVHTISSMIFSKFFNVSTTAGKTRTLLA
jgi:hypothetical protein